MVNLPNPFSSAASDAAADKAAASISQPLALDVAATSFDSGDTDCPLDEAAATLRQSDDAAADFSDIGEIFVGARKLDQLPGDEPGTRDLPDVPQGLIEALEPMPLFLLRTG